MMRLPLTLLIAVVVVGCSTRVNPPPRPKGIPVDAVWAGGTDGGSFIKCAFEAKTALDTCSVFNDRTGELEAQGEYKLTGRSRAQDAVQFKYSGFDGHRIYLMDGSVLVPSAAIAP
jgi:hypothetical protein